MTDTDRKFMRQAIDLSIENVRNGGRPFGAVIVRNGEVVATGVNNVVPLRPMQRSVPYAKHAKRWGISNSTVVLFIPLASRVPCVSAPYTGLV